MEPVITTTEGVTSNGLNYIASFGAVSGVLLATNIFTIIIVIILLLQKRKWRLVSANLCIKLTNLHDYFCFI